MAQLKIKRIFLEIGSYPVLNMWCCSIHGETLGVASPGAPYVAQGAKLCPHFPLFLEISLCVLVILERKRGRRAQGL